MLCSKDFNMSDLLKLKEIQALALLAEAIIDLPEYLTDKIGKMRLGYIPEHTITGSLDEIGNALNVISERYLICDIKFSTDYTSSRMTITETRLIIFLKVTKFTKGKNCEDY